MAHCAIDEFCAQAVDPANFQHKHAFPSPNYGTPPTAPVAVHDGPVDSLRHLLDIQIIQFYHVHSITSPRFFHVGGIDLYLYPSDQARINLSIPAHDTYASSTPRSLLSLQQYLDQLDGFVTPDPTFVVSDPIDQPSIMDVFGVPRFSCHPTNPHRQPLSQSSQSIERVFTHPHIRAPLALLDLGHLVCAAYPSIPCLNDDLAFHPHELDEFKRQFIAYQLQMLKLYFLALGAAWPDPIDYRSVFIHHGWWVLVHLPLIESRAPFDYPVKEDVSPFRQWAHGHTSTFEYLVYLNQLAGRSLNSMHIHPVMPWVTDFTTHEPDDPLGLRDLRRTKYRLKKGDEQLDMTYLSGDPPHHINTILTDLSLCTLMARVLPESILRLHIRERFSSAEVPPSAAATYSWTSDECIPEWYSDPTVIHGLVHSVDTLGNVQTSTLATIPTSVPPLELPKWAQTPSEFICRHRELLESTAVSSKIHRWIDLIFGHCLVGEAAILAKNVALPLAYPESKFVSRHHGIRQLFTCPHPPRLAETNSSLEDLELVAAFDAKYFGLSSPLKISLPEPVHPSLPHLYAYVLGVRQRHTTTAWPATSVIWAPEAVEVAVHHALRILPLHDLMDRSWLRMHHTLFVQIFGPLLSIKTIPTQSVSTNALNSVSPHCSTEFISPLSALTLAVQYLGPLVILDELWSPISQAVIDWDANSFLDGQFIVSLAKLFGPVLTRSRIFPLLGILLRKMSSPNLLPAFLNIGKLFGTPYMRQVIFPFLTGEAFQMCHSSVQFERITIIARGIVERIGASDMADARLVNQVAHVLEEAVGRTHPGLICFALDLAQCVIRHPDENKAVHNELISTLTTLCEVSVNSPKESPLGDRQILMTSYTLVCSILGHHHVRSHFKWAATAEKRASAPSPSGFSAASTNIAVSMLPPISRRGSTNGFLQGSENKLLSRSIALIPLPFSMDDLRVSRSSTANSTDSLLARSAPLFMDGDTYASQIWNQSNEFMGRRIWRFSGHPGLQCVGYMPHTRHVITGSKDKTVKLWSLDGILRDVDVKLNTAVQPAQNYALHQDPVSEVCDFGPYVLSCDGSIHVWDAATAQSIVQITTKHSLGLMQPWQNMRLVVGASTNGTVFVNDIRTRSAPLHFATGVGFSGSITTIAISKRAAVVATGSSSGAISVLDIHMGALLATWRAHDAGITKACFPTTLLEIKKNDLDESTFPATDISICHLLCISYGDNTLYIWNADSFVLQKTVKISSLTDISFLHVLDESTMLAMDSNRNLTIIMIQDTDSVLKISTTSNWKPIPSRVQSSVVFMDDNLPFLILGGHDGKLHGFI